MLEAGGSFTSADLWFAVPTTWSAANVAVRLYARLGTIRVLLTTLALSDAGGLTSGGLLSGLAASTRGRPCNGYVVSVEHDSVTPLENGSFSINAWSGAESPEVFGGAPFGEDLVRGPVRVEPSVALMAGQVVDSGPPGERFHLLRLDEDGRLEVSASPTDDSMAVEGLGTSGSPTGGVLTVQGPASGTLSVAAVGVGTAGSPSGGVVTVQGPASGTLTIAGQGSEADPAGGVLSVQGPGDVGQLMVINESGGSLLVRGARTPAANMSNPTTCLDTGAFLFGWDGSNWDRIAVATPGDSMSNPSDALGSASFSLGWDGSNWKRMRMQTIASVSSIANASAPPGLASASFLYGYQTSGSQWVRAAYDSNGAAQVVLPGMRIDDDYDTDGVFMPEMRSFLSHRDKDDMWFASRGGFGSSITSTGLRGILNVIGTAAYNTSAPAPSNGGAAALQSDARGSVVVVQGKPANDARDTPSLIDFNGVDKGIIKNAAGNLLSIECSTMTAVTTLWLHVFNKATNPANGDTPIWRVCVSIKGFYSCGRDMFSPAGIRLSSGISFALSTNRATLTLVGGTPDVAVNATYV